MNNNVVLKAKSVSKFFGTITALNDVDLELKEGEVLGVVGDNGAGKSTLMKVLSGLYKPSEGNLYFDNNQVVLNSPRDSQILGLEEPISSTIEALDVYESSFKSGKTLHTLIQTYNFE